jgi:hypothetical protein
MVVEIVRFREKLINFKENFFMYVENFQGNVLSFKFKTSISRRERGKEEHSIRYRTSINFISSGCAFIEIQLQLSRRNFLSENDLLKQED